MSLSNETFRPLALMTSIARFDEFRPKNLSTFATLEINQEDEGILGGNSCV